MAALKLFELVQQHKELELLLESGELPEDLIRDTLEGVTGELQFKCASIAHVVLNLEAMAAAIDEAATAMKARAQRIQKRSDSIRAYMLYQMQAADIKKVETAEFAIARRANPVAVIVANEGAIPADYWVQPEPPPPRIDKKLLRAALQSGAVVRGAYLESSERLDIKP